MCVPSRAHPHRWRESSRIISLNLELGTWNQRLRTEEHVHKFLSDILESRAGLMKFQTYASIQSQWTKLVAGGSVQDTPHEHPKSQPRAHTSIYNGRLRARLGDVERVAHFRGCHRHCSWSHNTSSTRNFEFQCACGTRANAQCGSGDADQLGRHLVLLPLRVQ
jgi:hypothetical protein